MVSKKKRGRTVKKAAKPESFIASGSKTLIVRVEAALVELLDAEAAYQRSAGRGVVYPRSHVVRTLLYEGLMSRRAAREADAIAARKAILKKAARG